VALNRDHKLVLTIAILSFLLTVVVLFPVVRYAWGGTMDVINSTAENTKGNSFLSSPLSVIQIGYSLSTLAPISSGVPVYATGDSIWSLDNSSSQVSMQLSPPSSVTSPGKYEQSLTLQPYTAAEFYSFNSTNDFEGQWLLNITYSTSPSISVPITVLNYTGNSLNPTLSSYGIERGNLMLNYTVDSTNAYDSHACLVHEPRPNALSISVPSSSGNGEIQIIPSSGKSVLLESTTGQSRSFEFWFELYYNYSYTNSGGSGVATVSYETARSTTVLISQSISQIVPLQVLVPMRNGVFVLRAFFESSTGLSVSETKVFIDWSNLDFLNADSCNISSSLGPEVSLDTTLNSSSTDWPNNVFFSYAVEGVSFVTEAQLGVSIGALNVNATPWDIIVHDLNISTDNALSYLSDGSLIVIGTASSFSTGTNYSVSLGNDIIQEGHVVLVPGSTVALPVRLAKLQVQLARNQSPLGNSTVLIQADNYGVTVAGKTDSGGNLVFYLPSGNYTISSSFGGKTLSENVTMISGESQSIALDFLGNSTTTSRGNTPSPILSELVTVASVLTVVGIGMNIWIWILRRRAQY
jgi:hypothetical protein